MTSRILVVEDDASVAELLSTLLAVDGHAVTVAHDGIEGLFQLDSGQHDLVVLDVMMPDVDGIHVLRQVERELARDDDGDSPYDIPMIVVTGDVAAAATCRGILGDRNVFTKPFDPSDVVARVSELLPTSKA